MVFASLLTLHWFAKCNCKLTTEGYLLKDVIRTHTKGIAFSVIFSFTFVKFLLRKGVWCARMFALVFGSRVCEGCVCRYILCQCGQPMGGYTNAQQYTCWWRGWHFKHRKVDLFKVRVIFQMYSNFIIHSKLFLVNCSRPFCVETA